MGLTTLHVGAMSSQMLAKNTHYQDLLYGLFYGFVLIIAIYSLLLGIRLGDRENVLYCFYVVFSGLSLAVTFGTILELQGSWIIAMKHNYGIIVGINSFISMSFALSFLQLKQRSRWLYWIGTGLLIILAIAVIGVPLMGQYDQQLQFNLSTLSAFSVNFFGLLAGIIISIQGYKTALFYTFGRLSLLLSASLFTLSLYSIFPFTFWTLNSILIGTVAEIIFYLLGLTYKINQLKKNQEEAILEQLRLTKENQQLIETQKQALEEQVEQRTAELRASQAQLIQKEKLASLGELTAGIAHEIQNPLNFVNNFSEVSTELVDELEAEIDKGDPDEAKLIAGDLRQNLQKITHHGSRASAIVKGMLEHSRSSTGERQPTNLNALADEYLRLAYHGLRAKDKHFNAELVTDFAPNLGPVEVMPQEIGRVLLNLYNNAFYAVQQKQKSPLTPERGTTYQPTVTVSTLLITSPLGGRGAEIHVRDNGTGIPDAIRGKIFQPFFTTKPTGEGTGLGLSLSYDIVTKGHGGTLEVESHEGEGAEFVIRLPY